MYRIIVLSVAVLMAADAGAAEETTAAGQVAVTVEGGIAWREV